MKMSKQIKKIKISILEFPSMDKDSNYEIGITKMVNLVYDRLNLNKKKRLIIK